MNKVILLILIFACLKVHSQTVVINETKATTRDTLLRIDPNPAKGFNFPYFLFIPELASKTNTTIIVEPNNTGKPNDTLQVHEEDARLVANRSFHQGNYVARKLNIPLLVPVFPRPKKDWKIYTHALDRDAIRAKGEIKRLDLQLIAMVADAREQLKQFGITADNQLFITGFSASGTFANRFTLIHPELVKGCACGGVNGMLILPLERKGNQKLKYPIGTSDFKARFGKKFDLPHFAAVPQFIFMGEQDTNDATKFSDGYSIREQSTIHFILGKEMLPKRWEECKRIYRDHHINASFITYPGIGHKTNEKIKDDITGFFGSILEK